MQGDSEKQLGVALKALAPEDRAKVFVACVVRAVAAAAPAHVAREREWPAAAQTTRPGASGLMPLLDVCWVRGHDVSCAAFSSKIPPNDCGQLAEKLAETLGRLQIESLDLYQVHWPIIMMPMP
jgi:aryl-alcohol dehydrogenase-like predicted oxidoreductase